MNSRIAFAAALLVELIGAAAALLMALRPWQTIHLARSRPFSDVVLQVSGRTVDGAVTGVALVALAGVVAVLATKGIGRQIVGGLVAVSGVLIAWRAAADFSALSQVRARSLVIDKRGGAGVLPNSHATIAVHSSWPALTIVAGVLVAVAGLLIAVKGGRWSAMSSRYEAPVASSAVPSTDEAMWSALDRGDDPTAAG